MQTQALVPVLFTFILAPAVAQPPAVPKMLQLFQDLQNAQVTKQPGSVKFHFTEAEVNEYLRYSLHRTPRPGLHSVSVKFFPANYVSTYTVVDFDAVERWKPGTVPLLLKPVLNGRKAIWVDYRFRTEQGKATFSVEKAYFQKLRLPAYFVEKMIQIVAARQPEAYDTTKAVPLPFGLRTIATGPRRVSGAN